MSQHQEPAPSPSVPAQAEGSAELEFDGQAGAALHRHRRRLGLTATEVARRVGISQRRMSRLELGLEPLTLRLAIGLGAVLGMPAGWFLTLEAATVPEAIGLSIGQAHEDWARSLLVRISTLAKGDLHH